MIPGSAIMPHHQPPSFFPEFELSHWYSIRFAIVRTTLIRTASPPLGSTGINNHLDLQAEFVRVKAEVSHVEFHVCFVD